MSNDHELYIAGGSPSTTQGLKLVRQDGRALYSVTELAPEHQEELRFTQSDWKGGHGRYDFLEPDRYFEGSSIDTTQDGRFFLGPLINEINENDDTDLDGTPIKFLWFNAISKYICATPASIYVLGLTGPLFEYYSPAPNYQHWVYDDHWSSQTFAPIYSHTILSVKLQLVRFGSPGTITVNIKATTAGKPSGAVLCTGTTDGDTLPTTTPGEWRSITLGAGTALTAGTTYAIEVSAPSGTSSNLMGWRNDTIVKDYPRGTAVTSTDSGSNWTVQTYDFMFKEYGTGTTDKWGAATTTLAGVTDLIEYNGVVYAAMGGSTKYYYSTDGNTWTQTDLTNGYADGFVVSPNPEGTADVLRLFKYPNEVRNTTDGRTVAAGGVQWSSVAYIGDTSYNINKMFLLADQLYVGREDQLYKYTATGRVDPQMEDLAVNRSTNNFKYLTRWKNAAYFSLLTGLGEITTSDSFDSMGPITEIDDIGKAGTCVGLASDAEYIYAAIDEGTNTIIYKGRQISRENGLRWEWCPFVNLGTEECLALEVCQHSLTDRRLWFGYGPSTGYVSLFDDPAADSNATFAATGWIRMSYIYGSDPYWDKMFQSVITETANCTANITVTPKYRKDTDTSATSMTSAITTNGHVKTDLTAEKSCKRIQFELHLATNSSSTTPIVKYFQVRGIEKPETVRIHECTYSLGTRPSQKASTVRTFLRLGRTVTTLLKFSDLRYTPKGINNATSVENTDWVWVTMMPGSPKEVEIYHEKSKQPELALQVQFREVNF